jgi:pimeloyl-ACP methyl ester carboxylesterase
MHQYSCRVADLPEHGKSFEQGPFEMAGAAAAVAELVCSCVRTGPAHVAGLSRGAQLGVQLLATEPGIADRALLYGTNINGIPGVGLVQPIRTLVAWIARW